MCIGWGVCAMHVQWCVCTCCIQESASVCACVHTCIQRPDVATGSPSFAFHLLFWVSLLPWTQGSPAGWSSWSSSSGICRSPLPLAPQCQGYKWAMSHLAFMWVLHSGPHTHTAGYFCNLDSSSFNQVSWQRSVSIIDFCFMTRNYEIFSFSSTD